MDAFPPGQRLALALGLFVAAMTVRSALVFARDLQLARIQADYEASLRLRAAATLARRGWSHASRIGQAGMQSLLLTDVPRVAAALAFLQLFAVASAMLIVQLALAAILSPLLSALAFVILAGGSLLQLRWTRRGVTSGIAISERSEQSAGSGFRLHAGLKAALAQGTVAWFLAEYRASLAAARHEVVRFAGDVSAARALGFFGSAIAAALLFFVGSRLLALPFPILVAALVLFARVAAPAQQLQQAAQNIAAYAPSFVAIGRRLGGLDRAASDDAPAPEPLEWAELRIDDAAFEHSPGVGVAGVSLTLKRGEWLGIGGPSGAGKTTLVDLAAGLLAPQRGSVLVDGERLDGPRLGRWRAGLAYVGQDGSVFDDSVRRNLLADSNGHSDEALWEALGTVGLAERIRAFARGLDEPLGDRGSSLSGGERQRLAIARALLRRPSLLLLDEATAALDADSEAALLKRVAALQPRPAAIIVAHRASTLEACDSVLTIRHQGERSRDEPSELAR
jgi:ATP-binding cassette subfamily C protein